MNSLLIVVAAVVLSGCGYASHQNELNGQVKKVVNQTPLICANRVDADISLGIMRNGVGSMSSEDIWVTVPKESDQRLLRKAAEGGQVVKVTYDSARVTFCVSPHIVTRVELVR